MIFIAGDEKKVCVTTSGPSVGNPCKFPFKFKGVVHYECTWIEGRGKPWCATLVNEDGRIVEGEENRGVCGPDCPIPPDPENATYSGSTRHATNYETSTVCTCMDL